MIKDLKQLFSDLQDKNAGSKISQWPIKTPLVLYTKYYSILVVIVILSIVYSLVYFVPQLPKILSDSLPDISLRVEKNQAIVIPETPLKLTSPDGAFIIDTREIPDDYSTYPTGVFVYRNYSEIRDSNGVSQRYDFQNLKGFEISKPQIVNWFTDNKTKLITILVPAVLVISLFISGFIWGLRVLGFYLWSTTFHLGFKLLKRPLLFKQIVPVVTYASILPLLVSYILFFAPHPLLNLLNFALFIFFTLSWLLPLSKK